MGQAYGSMPVPLGKKYEEKTTCVEALFGIASISNCRVSV